MFSRLEGNVTNMGLKIMHAKSKCQCGMDLTHIYYSCLIPTGCLSVAYPLVFSKLATKGVNSSL